MFVLVFVFRLARREFAFELELFEFEFILASTISMTIKPMAMIPTIAPPPTIHKIALDFFLGIALGTDAGGGAHGAGLAASTGGREAGGCDSAAGGLLAGGNDG